MILIWRIFKVMHLLSLGEKNMKNVNFENIELTIICTQPLALQRIQKKSTSLAIALPKLETQKLQIFTVDCGTNRSGNTLTCKTNINRQS